LVGYKRRIIQDVIIQANNISYELEIWVKAYILHQYYECCVSQPLIYSTLKDLGVKISTGQISNILIEDKELYHAEKASLLAKVIPRVGLIF